MEGSACRWQICALFIVYLKRSEMGRKAAELDARHEMGLLEERDDVASCGICKYLLFLVDADLPQCEECEAQLQRCRSVYCEAPELADCHCACNERKLCADCYIEHVCSLCGTAVCAKCVWLCDTTRKSGDVVICSEQCLQQTRRTRQKTE